MRVVVAPDKFRGSLTALEVGSALAGGLRAAEPGLEAVVLPVADGGEGTVAAALAAGFSEVAVDVEGPTGEQVRSRYARDGRRAVLELAAACGLDLLPGGRPDPLGASTYGLGQLIGHAVDAGVTDLLLGVGGSASTDGGAGLVQALGGRLRDRAGAETGRGGGALAGLATLDAGPLRRRLAGVRVVAACDVDHPLLGPGGAAAVFGPQKGATPDDVARLDAGLAVWAQVVARTVGADRSAAPGAGAAGGTAFAALTLLGATLAPGADLVLELLDVDTVLRGADLVVTGEGSLDRQSLAGKAPVGVAAAAGRHGVPVVAVAGRNLLDAEQLRAAGFSAVYPLSDLEPDPARSIAHAAALLHRVGQRIAREWGTAPPQG